MTRRTAGYGDSATYPATSSPSQRTRNASTAAKRRQWRGRHAPGRPSRHIRHAAAASTPNKTSPNTPNTSVFRLSFGRPGCPPPSSTANRSGANATAANPSSTTPAAASTTRPPPPQRGQAQPGDGRGRAAEDTDERLEQQELGRRRRLPIAEGADEMRLAVGVGDQAFHADEQQHRQLRAATTAKPNSPRKQTA